MTQPPNHLRDALLAIARIAESFSVKRIAVANQLSFIAAIARTALQSSAQPESREAPERLTGFIPGMTVGTGGNRLAAPVAESSAERLDEACAKCGATDMDDHFNYGSLGSSGRIDRTCRNCRYTWSELPLDARLAAQAQPSGSRE